MLFLLAMQEVWVLLRGLGRESAHWGEFPKTLERELANHQLGANVDCLDLPGFGRSADDEIPWTIQATVNQLRAQIQKRHGASATIFLVGLSMGGMLSLHWQQAFPQDLRGVVAINTSSSDCGPFWHRIRPASGIALFRSLKCASEERERHILNVVSNRPEVQEQVAPHWATIAQHQQDLGLKVLRQLVAASRFRVNGINVPTLLLGSAGDRLVDVRCSKALSRDFRIPLRVHPWAGHDLPLDDPQWLLREVISWRRTIDVPTSVGSQEFLKN